MRQLYERTSLFAELEELPGLLWFSPAAKWWTKGYRPEDGEDEAPPELYSPEWKAHLPQIAGAIVGLAAYNGIYLDLRLHPLIYRFFVQRGVATSFEDLRSVHPTLYRSLRSIRTTDVKNLGLTWAVRLPAVDVDFDLARGSFCDPAAEAGAAAPAAEVQSSEVGRFVEAYAEAALVGAMRPQVEAFVESAVGSMATGSAFALCTANDLELLLCGSPDVGNFEELERSCSYANGFTAESPTVHLLWKAVHGMSEVTKRKLLLFCTGCDRVPILGLRALNFAVAYSAASVEHLPTANTCINQLNLPAYTTAEMMSDRLYAALEHHAGFGFV